MFPNSTGSLLVPFPNSPVLAQTPLTAESRAYVRKYIVFLCSERRDLLRPQAKSHLLLPPISSCLLQADSVFNRHILQHDLFCTTAKNQPSKLKLGRLLLLNALNQLREDRRATRAGAGEHHRPLGKLNPRCISCFSPLLSGAVEKTPFSVSASKITRARRRSGRSVAVSLPCLQRGQLSAQGRLVPPQRKLPSPALRSAASKAQRRGFASTLLWAIHLHPHL